METSKPANAPERRCVVNLLRMETWMYVDSLGSLKGPIPTNILLKLLEKGINISGETTVWKEGMTEWEKMANVSRELAVEIIEFHRLNPFLSLFDSLLSNGIMLMRIIRRKVQSSPGTVVTSSSVDFEQVINP
jgi:hypothetical protein